MTTSTITLVLRGDASGAVKVLKSTADSAEKELGRAGAASNRWSNQLQQMQRVGIAAFAALAAGAVAASVGIVAGMKRSIDVFDETSKSAQKVGIATEALSKLRHAAQLSGIENAQLESSLKQLINRQGEAVQGNKLYAAAFSELGVAVTDGQGRLRGTLDVLGDLAEQFQRMPDGPEKTKRAIELFGKAGSDMIPLLNAGRDGLAEMADEAERLGLVIGGDAARQAEAFNDNLSRLQSVATGVFNTLAAELLPSLVQLTQSWVDGAKEGNAYRSIADGISSTFKGVAIVVLTVANAFQTLGSLMGAGIAVAVEVATTIKEQFNGLATSIEGYWAALKDLDPAAALEALDAGFDGLVERADASFERVRTIQREALADAQGNIADVTGAYTALFDSADTTADAIERTGKQAARSAAQTATLSNRTGEAAKAQNELEKMLRASEAALGRYDQQASKAHDILQQLRSEVAGPVRQAEIEHQQRISAITEAFASLGRGALPDLLEALDLERQRHEAAAEAAQLHEDGLGGLASYLEQLDNIGLGGLVNEIEMVGKALEQATDPAVIDKLQARMGDLQHSMRTAMIDTAQQGLRSLQSMSSEGSKAFAAMQIAIDALSLAQAISAVLNQGQGDPYTAFARMAAMAAAVAALVGSIGSFGGGFDDTAAQRQATQGTGTVLGDAEADSASIRNGVEITAAATSALVGINRGMLNALMQLQGNIGNATGMLARGAGSVDFSGINQAVDTNFWHRYGLLERMTGIFGARSENTDQGIRIAGGDLMSMLGNLDISAYNEVQSRSWWGGSTRTNTAYQPLGDDVAGQFELIMQSIVDTVRESATALGLVPADIEAALAQFRVEEIRISLMDLSAEEQQAELQAVFSSIFDGLAGSIVPFIEQFQRVGEGLGETLVRVATGVQVTQEALLRLGFALDETDPEQFAIISESLIALTGGIEDFVEGMMSFVDNFATEAFKFETLQSDLTRAFEQAGMVVPETRDGMWELMQSLDATTESGREQIATLLRLSDTADAYYAQLERNEQTLARLWDGYYERFLSEQERAQLVLARTQVSATAAFESIGLSLDAFTGSTGLQDFRTLFESVLPSLTAEQVVMWLQAGAALGAFGDAAADFADTIAGATETIISALDELRGLRDLDRNGGRLGIPIAGGTGGTGGLPGPGPRDPDPSVVGREIGDWLDRMLERLLGGRKPTDPIIPGPVSDPPGLELPPDFTQQLADLLDGLRFDASLRGMTDLQRAVAQLNRQWDEIVERASDMAALPEELKEIEALRMRELDALRQEYADRALQEIEERYRVEMDWVQRLRGFVDSLTLNESLTTLTPQEQLEEAQRQYAETLAAARAGDEDARNAIQSMAQQRLREEREYWGSSSPYTEAFDQIRRDMDALATMTERQVLIENGAKPIFPVDDTAGIRHGGETMWTVSDTQPWGVSGPTAKSSEFVPPKVADSVVGELVGLREDGGEQTAAMLARIDALTRKVAELTTAAERQAAETRRLADAAIVRAA